MQTYSPALRAVLHGRRGPGGLPVHHDPDPERTLTLSTASSGSASDVGPDTPRKRYKYCPTTDRMRLAKPSQDAEKLDDLASGATTPMSYCTAEECHLLLQDVWPDTMPASALRHR